MDWLAACIALGVQVGAVSRADTCPKCSKPCWPLLTNKKQVNLDSIHVSNIIKPMQTPINRVKYCFCVKKSLEHLKIENWSRPLFRPRTYHACHQKPNPSREIVPLGSQNTSGMRFFGCGQKSTARRLILHIERFNCRQIKARRNFRGKSYKVDQWPVVQLKLFPQDRACQLRAWEIDQRFSLERN